MARIAYVNGRYRPLHGAAVPAEDRGYQFADGVYEVIKVLRGQACDLERHLDRLARSLAALDIAPPMPRRALQSVLHETLRRNRLANALLYLQVTRGAAPRNHLFPKAARPSLVLTVRRPAFPGRFPHGSPGRRGNSLDARDGRLSLFDTRGRGGPGLRRVPG